MKSNIFKIYLKLIIIIVLVIPIFFGFNMQFSYFSKMGLFEIFLILICLLFLIIVGIFIVKYIFNANDYEKMKEHEIIKGFICKNIKLVTISFLLTIIIEELIFRFYIMGILIININVISSIMISSVIFSLYHIHIFFYFRISKIIWIYLGYSFLIGFVNGIILNFVGLFCCIIDHFFIVYMIYYWLFRSYNSKS